MSKQLFAASISVGGSHGAHSLGVMDYLIHQGREYGVVAGNSVGSILAAAYAANKWNEAKAIFTNMETSDVIKSLPNLFTVTKAAVLKRNYIADWDPLRELLYNVLKGSEWTKPCYVGYTNLHSGDIRYHNISGPGYSDEFRVEEIMASCLIPIIGQPVKVNGFHCVDGGLIDVNPVGHLIQSIGPGYHIDVINSRNLQPEWMSEEEFDTLPEMAQRSFQIMQANQLNREMKMLRLYNELAKANDGIYTDNHTAKQYYYVDYTIYEPNSLYDQSSLDFSDGQDLYDRGWILASSVIRDQQQEETEKSSVNEEKQA